MVSIKRLLGYSGAVLVVVFGAAMSLLLMRACELHARRSHEKHRRDYMASQIRELKSGDRIQVLVLAPICLEDLAADVDCLPRVTNMRIVADLSDPRWGLLGKFPNLKEIGIYDSGNADVFLTRIRGMEPLESFTLQATGLSDSGMKDVATLPNLKKLDVGGPGVTNDGIVHLQGHANLETLELHNTNVTDDGVAALKDIPTLRTLVLFRESWRGQCPSDSGLKHLENITQLEELEVSGGWASEAAVADLKNALPDCEIRTTHRP